jgi:hypothetical protein
MRNALARFRFRRGYKVRIHRSSRPQSVSGEQKVSVSGGRIVHTTHESSVATGGVRVESGLGSALTREGATYQPHAPVAPRQGAPRSAHRWVQANPREVRRHRDRWIAVTKDGIVTTSQSIDGVYKRARAKGVHNPLVFKVPSDTKTKRIVSVRR